MCEVLAVIHEKGGVAKTTTAANLAAALVRLDPGKRVLLIDTDTQGSLCGVFGIRNVQEIPITLANALNSIIKGVDFDLKSPIIRHEKTNLDIIPSNEMLETTDNNLYALGHKERPFILKGYIDQLRNDYDHIIIDCRPTAGALFTNALVACDSVIIPTQPEQGAKDSLTKMFKTIGRVKRSYNENITPKGILLTMVDARYGTHMRVAAEIKRDFAAANVFKSYIPARADIKKAAENYETIFDYAPKSDSAQAYENLAKEVSGNGRRKLHNRSR